MTAAVIGGGASGMMCAIELQRGGVDVILFEKNDKLGKKLFITGKGRCNLTNDCDADGLRENIVRGERFLRSAFAGFAPKDTMEYFEKLGVRLKVERGGRVFPLSDKSSDIIRALERELKRLGADIRLECEVKSVECASGGYLVKYSGGQERCDALIVATGGASYPVTGSTGDGYRFAKSLGHAVIPPKQALVALNFVENVAALEGLSLKNVRLTAYDDKGKKIADEFGEMLFTKRGASGPIVLSASSYAAGKEGVRLSLDLKPAVESGALEERMIRELAERQNSDMRNVMRSFAPDRLNTYLLLRAGIPAGKKANSLTKEERAALINVMKGLSFTVAAPAPFEEAVITAGGVELKELTPKCESKLHKGLYFVGEVIDADALTGGFNLQIAWATAQIAAKDILSKRL